MQYSGRAGKGKLEKLYQTYLDAQSEMSPATPSDGDDAPAPPPDRSPLLKILLGINEKTAESMEQKQMFKAMPVAYSVPISRHKIDPDPTHFRRLASSVGFVPHR